DGNNNSNRLMKVTDAASVGASQGFNNGNSGTSNDYTYDGNGNMLSDLNKNITSISYNFLNLPEAITFGNGSSIEYIYNAAGVKVMKTVNNIRSEERRVGKEGKSRWSQKSEKTNTKKVNNMTL